MKTAGIDKPTVLFSKEAWLFFGRFYKGLHRRLIATSLGSAAQVVLIVPALLLIKYAFDEVIPEGRIDLLIYIGLAIVGLRLLNAASTLWMRHLNIKLINTAIFRLRQHLFERLYTLPRSFHTREDPRLMHARIVQDTERLTHLSTAIISKIFPSLLISAALCVVLFFLNVYLLLAVLAIGPILFVANRFMGKRIKQKVIVFQRSFEKFSKGTLFVLRYMDLTHIQSAQDEEVERQTMILDELREKTGSMAYIFAFNTQLQEVLTGLSGILIIILGGASVAAGSMSLGDFIAFYLAASFLNRHINMITSSFPDVLAGNESMLTLQALSERDEHLPYKGKKEISFLGELELKDVHFSYGEKEVLKGINLHIAPGEKIALIGANGAGKTTLIHLILGFYRPSSGSLSADGYPYDDLTMEGLRRSMGVVMQNPPLFAGSISENILYGNPDASQEDVIKACEAAGVDDLIRGLSDSYYTQIGEDGVRLSGGERQRLAIARALVRKPGLLILDEPTNHLDKNMVARIMSQVSDLEYHPAILLISHDAEVVSFADRVYKLIEGSLN